MCRIQIEASADPMCFLEFEQNDLLIQCDVAIVQLFRRPRGYIVSGKPQYLL